VEVLAQKAAGRRGSSAPAEPLASLGEHPEGGPVVVMPGKYGPYVKWGKVNATLPKGIDPAAFSLEEALALVAEKAGKTGKKAAPKKVAAAKVPVKKAGVKKAGVKKAAVKKAAVKTVAK
jgi:DNA topoisomerase-1